MALLGTAIIIFVFRAVPSPGAGAGWFVIDVLGFDQRFPFGPDTDHFMPGIWLEWCCSGSYVATRTIADVVAVPDPCGRLCWRCRISRLYYGLSTNGLRRAPAGVVDARFIAILDTAIESPFAQVAMIPMLAWIAQYAPSHLKATFFAVMASFTNLALSASNLGTKYLNRIFEVTREVRDRTTGDVTVPADYSELGWLLITVAVIGVTLPITAIILVQRSRLRTQQ